MKTIKSYSLKTLVNLAFVLILLNFSCAQSGNKDSQSTDNVSKIETPEVAIQMAILSNNIEAVKQHISAGTDLNEKDAMSGSTPLITAASFGRHEIAKLLIDAKVDLIKTNNDGATALHTAAFFCRAEVVSMLLEAKADKTLKNSYGQTPLESISGPFEQVKPIYEMLKQQLQPMGMEIDIDVIEQTRPLIAEMLH